MLGGKWTRSSSSYATGNCVEARTWRKAGASGATECVEVGPCTCGASVQVRDSKDPDGPVLSLSTGEWAAFLAGVRAGDFG